MKKFLIVGHISIVSNKDFFPYLKNKKISSGVTNFNSGAAIFNTPKELYDSSKMNLNNQKFSAQIDDDHITWRVNGVRWFSSLNVNGKRTLKYNKIYSKEDYPKYDNYNAINVNCVKDIPVDYYGVMGVPMGIFDFNMDEYEIIDTLSPTLNGKKMFKRIFIKRKKSMKKFLIVGNKNALTWKETFPLYMSGECRYGYTRPNQMILPFDAKKFNKIEDGEKIVNMQGTTKWITTFPVLLKERVKPVCVSNPEYIDNMDIVNTNSIYEIPDCDCVVEVPIDVLSYLPDGYEVVGKLKTGNEPYDWGKPIVGGKIKYVRILIKRIP